jgi:LmbE family N-acetylglucosaminyl deacetylase
MEQKKVAVIVAHPDDETLWAGGTILNHPLWKCFVVSLCRENDKERSLKFRNALKILKSDGIMGNLDDGPEQLPLTEKEVETAILYLMPKAHFNLVITHNLSGEYTRHIRHEETGRAVINLWHTNKISTDELWTFAYEDGNKNYYPRAIENADIYQALTNQIWKKKFHIITNTYGFEKNSWEAETTPKAESFWKFKSPEDAKAFS